MTSAVAQTERPAPRAQPRQARAELTRNAIVTSGRALVRARGHSGWTLRDVARGAPCSPAAVYRYFTDKDALLCALVEDHKDALVASLAQAAARAPASYEGITNAYVHAVLDVYARDPTLAGPLLALPPRLGAWRLPLLPPALLALVDAAVRRHAPEVFQADPRAAHRVLVAGQAIIAARHRAETPSLEVTARIVERLALTSLGAKSPRVEASMQMEHVVDGGGRFALSERTPTRSDARPGYDASLIAAAELFASRGVAGATTHAIAERAGVSVGSLYRYFPTKQALCAALASRINDAFAARACAALTQASGIEAAIDGVLEAARVVMLEHRALLGALSHGLVTPPFLELPPIPSSLIAPTRALLARHATAFDDPALAAFATLHAGHALCLDALLTDGSIEAAAAPVRRILLALLLR
jgi:AcrR family transcriptional regulator